MNVKKILIWLSFDIFNCLNIVNVDDIILKLRWCCLLCGWCGDSCRGYYYIGGKSIIVLIKNFGFFNNLFVFEL